MGIDFDTRDEDNSHSDAEDTTNSNPDNLWRENSACRTQLVERRPQTHVVVADLGIRESRAMVLVASIHPALVRRYYGRFNAIAAWLKGL